MLAVRLPGSIDRRLDNLARKTGRTKSFYVKKAILDFLEDREDYLLGLARLEQSTGRISLKEVARELGLDD
ncbi:MAG TPA: CopG family transcriptional regulator [Candidatus Binataceae bacterium]|nr:CopG family transcriptional regulator [Candidatus Binataceae bacterium]